MGNNKILIVGAGFAGCTIGRVLAEENFKVKIIDKRNHIGGNAYDYVNDRNERIHKYGPHLLHGQENSKAIKFLSRFTSWVTYEHKVRALLEDGTTTPLPVNRTTLEDVFDLSLKTDNDADKLLKSIKKKIEKPKNTDELFLSNVGEKLTNIFFRPYTKKMWGVDPKSLEVSIGARLPVRTNKDDRYFTDTFQALPANGYKELFKNIIDHKNIELSLNTEFRKSMEKNFKHCFLCLPIDSYFDFCFGSLPYRSLLFEEKISQENQDAPQINFTDKSKYTRKTQWNLLPNSPNECKNYKNNTITYEIPCDISENPGEYYYPVQTKESKKLYQKYVSLANQKSNISFCGRTGLFRYIDMVPSVTMHLDIVQRYLKKNS